MTRQGQMCLGWLLITIGLGLVLATGNTLALCLELVGLALLVRPFGQSAGGPV